MEDFVPMSNDNGGSRCSFVYGSPILGPPGGHHAGFGGLGSSSGCGNSDGHDSNSNKHCQGTFGITGAFHLQPATATEAVAHPALKTEDSHQHHHQNRDQAEMFCYSQAGDVAGGRLGAGEGSSEVEAIKAKIVAHHQYPDLLDAYMDCQKIGAPPDVVEKLSCAWRDFKSRQWSSVTSVEAASKDPELDQFMEAYYDMLVKYKEELIRPLQEAMEFMRKIETELNSLCSEGPISIFPSGSDADDKCGGVGSSEDEQQVNSGGETDQLPEINTRTGDQELKNHLLRKYSGYLSSLKQELSKKKKKGKLPKEARQKLLSWWELHYKWPYPSESEKVALAEATGLDQKQINNWFINQRKRHWKLSEDMQFMVMDGLHPQAAAFYMDSHYISDGLYH